jgi:hypothetical protein
MLNDVPTPHAGYPQAIRYKISDRVERDTIYVSVFARLREDAHVLVFEID